MYVRVSGDKKCLFSGKFGMLCVILTSVLRFVLLAYYLRNIAFNPFRVDDPILHPLKKLENLGLFRGFRIRALARDSLNKRK